MLGYRSVELTSDTYTETSESLSNPYMGWYTLLGARLSENGEPNYPNADNYTKDEAGLILLEVNLNNYSETDLTDNALSQLDRLFSAWRETGCQLILRFLYDWDGKALETEPSAFSQILRHIEQVAPIVNKYTDIIYIMQGVFVGNHGEMHSTKYMSNENLITLAETLYSLIDPAIYLAVRTPAQLRTITKTKEPLSADEAFSGSLISRLSLFNDGMLGTVYDTGTYGDASKEEAEYYYKWTRADEIEFQNQMCRYAPNGGEVVIDNTYNDIENAVADMSAMHVSYLNSAHDGSVLNKWKNSAYNGENGYDYITKHMGYRFMLIGSSISYEAPFGTEATLSLTIENLGFANCYKEFEVTVTAVSESGETAFSIMADTDTRFWDTDSETAISLSLPIRDIDAGTYRLYIQVYDPILEREILLANEGSHTEWGYSIGSLEISALLHP